ncbi:MAG: hypothetical protein QM687_08150 [Ferruginibacter sp.]
MTFELQASETIIDTWTLYYIAPGGKSTAGKLTVTNQRLLFLPQHEDDSFSLSLYNKKGMLAFDKSAIKNIGIKKSLLSKKVLVTMQDNSIHSFNYGIMNIDKLLAAVQSN